MKPKKVFTACFQALLDVMNTTLVMVYPVPFFDVFLTLLVLKPGIYRYQGKLASKTSKTA